MKRQYWIVSIVLAGLLLGTALWLSGAGESKMDRLESRVRKAVAQAAESPPAEGEYVSPVDFDRLREINSDVYGWLYVPGTDISEPLLQKDGDSLYYMTHGSSGDESQHGALFTESARNSMDFTDPATVIYGKNTKRGRLFSSLQMTYSSAEALDRYGKIIVYLPQEEIHYTVFGAIPFGEYHLLHYFNFGNENRFQAFLDTANSVRTLDTHWNYDTEVTADDQLLILSTTRSGNPNQSYLVLAKRMER